MKSRKGFTLAEVLVTLAIIGIVAALTIPSLIMGTAEKQAETNVKKVSSTLNQALAMSIATDFIDTSEIETDDDTELADIFAAHMHILDQTDGVLTLADGTEVEFVAGGACNSVNNNTELSATECYAAVTVDGDSEPYYFVINHTSVLPATNDVATGPCGDTGDDDACDRAAEIIMNN